MVSSEMSASPVATRSTTWPTSQSTSTHSGAVGALQRRNQPWSKATLEAASLLTTAKAKRDASHAPGAKAPASVQASPGVRQAASVERLEATLT